MTTWSARLPMRVRITAAFGVVMSLLLLGIGVIAYRSMADALLDEIDSGLRFRAAATASVSPSVAVETQDPRLQEPDEAFDQLVAGDGRVLRVSPGIIGPLLSANELDAVREPTFFERPVRNVVGTARLLAVPLGSPAERAVLIVGVTMSDRADALRDLGEVFAVGGPVAILLACLAGWVVAGWALHPMERMRQQASAITVSGLDHRLTVPPAGDELQHLAHTLNDMLERLDRSLVRERSFLERASHELRTPLAALRAEVDLALRQQRSADELTASLRSVSAETDRLTRLAEDLLVLARADGGRLPLHRETVSLSSTLRSAAGLFAARALELEITVTVDAPEATIEVDPLRLRQALVNLVDNALRHTPRHGTVRLLGAATETATRIVVSDTGPGFAALETDSADPRTAHEHHEYDEGSPNYCGSPGLGLRIVRAVVESHHGNVRIANSTNGGAEVELTLPRAEKPKVVTTMRRSG